MSAQDTIAAARALIPRFHDTSDLIERGNVVPDFDLVDGLDNAAATIDALVHLAEAQAAEIARLRETIQGAHDIIRELGR